MPIQILKVFVTVCYITNQNNMNNETNNFRVWKEINLNNLLSNFEYIKSLSNNKNIIPMIKDDAYGHNAVNVAKTLENDDKVLAFAVATIDEAKELIFANIKKDVLIISHTIPNNFSEIIKYNIIQTISSYEMAKCLSDIAVSNNKKARIEIAIDTGMNRIGFKIDNENIDTIDSTINEISKISKLPNIEIYGVFTHFSVADEDLANDVLDRNFTNNQADAFDKILDKLNTNNVKYVCSAISNSAGILRKYGEKSNTIRPGIILYGLIPSENFDEDIKNKLKPVLSLKSRIIHIKEIDEFESISYGRTFISDKKLKIATISVGYGDGYKRSLSNKGHVIINDTICKIVGRITMDMLMVDITNVNCSLYDEVILIGKSKSHEITVNDLAKMSSEFHYEMLTSINKRVPTIFIN